MNARKLSIYLPGIHDCKTCRRCRRKPSWVYSWGGNPRKKENRWVCFLCKNGHKIPLNATNLIPVTKEMVLSLMFMFKELTDTTNDLDTIKQNKEVWAAIKELSKHELKRI